MAIFDTNFVTELDKLTDEYIANSSRLEAVRWRKRPLAERMKEGASYLLSPLL